MIDWTWTGVFVALGSLFGAVTLNVVSHLASARVDRMLGALGTALESRRTVAMETEYKLVRDLKQSPTRAWAFFIKASVRLQLYVGLAVVAVVAACFTFYTLHFVTGDRNMAMFAFLGALVFATISFSSACLQGARLYRISSRVADFSAYEAQVIAARKENSIA